MNNSSILVKQWTHPVNDGNRQMRIRQEGQHARGQRNPFHVKRAQNWEDDQYWEGDGKPAKTSGCPMHFGYIRKRKTLHFHNSVHFWSIRYSWSLFTTGLRNPLIRSSWNLGVGCKCKASNRFRPLKKTRWSKRQFSNKSSITTSRHINIILNIASFSEKECDSHVLCYASAAWVSKNQLK